MTILERPLAEADTDACLRLVAEAGWNQTANDWKTIFEIGETCGLFQDGTLIATAAIVLHGPVGWVCMVLVTPSAQRRGHATHLLKWAGNRLDELGLTAGLDATPAGRQVYLHLGYTDIYPITRMQCDGPLPRATTNSSPAIRAVMADDLDALLALDHDAFGIDRSALVASLIRRRPDLASGIFDGDTCLGFVLAREGRRATQVGPLVARDEALAVELLHHVLDRSEGPVFIDLPDGHVALRAALEARNFTAQRTFTRMLRGKTQAFDDTRLVFALTGPEFA
ncbi:GNAT family N-acetyltransferase [Mesorhizobium sp. KR2-14]|uniref:GNAT family N-acetyltransferase n=1 Tax=Mesorhizobium sp. KR2-14 TaxID=3156610 RepID=UPI0032B4487B